MKSKFSLFALFMLIMSGLLAQDAQRRTLEDMGYRNESVIGIAGALTYFLKLQPGDDVNNTRLVLNIRPSQVLNKDKSTITIALKDEPVFTQRIYANAIDSILTIVIPLDKRYVQPDGRFIKLRVDAKLCMSDEYCKDVDNPAVWINVRNSSYLDIRKQSQASYNYSLKEIIHEFDRISTPVNSDLDDLLSGGVLFALIKQKASLGEIITDNYRETDSVSNTIVTGLFSKLPANIRAQIPDFSGGQGCIMSLYPYGDARQVLVVTVRMPRGTGKGLIP